MRRWLAATVTLACLTGCPAFWVERGELVRPAPTLDSPNVSQLPAAEAYLELADRWRRTTRLGVGGHISATILDPRLTAAQVAHEAAVGAWRSAVMESQLGNRWSSYYGNARDRWPIDLEWRFDSQFVASSRVLDPANWRLTLVTSDGRRFAPLAASILSSDRQAQDGYWDGRVRLWFPWREGGRLVLGGENDWVRLELEHRSGEAELTWRFGSVY